MPESQVQMTTKTIVHSSNSIMSSVASLSTSTAPTAMSPATIIAAASNGTPTPTNTRVAKNVIYPHNLVKVKLEPSSPLTSGTGLVASDTTPRVFQILPPTSANPNAMTVTTLNGDGSASPTSRLKTTNILKRPRPTTAD